MLEGDRQGTSLPDKVCWACHHAAQRGYTTADSQLEVDAKGSASPAGWPEHVTPKPASHTEQQGGYSGRSPRPHLSRQEGVHEVPNGPHWCIPALDALCVLRQLRVALFCLQTAVLSDPGVHGAALAAAVQCRRRLVTPAAVAHMAADAAKDHTLGVKWSRCMQAPRQLKYTSASSAMSVVQRVADGCMLQQCCRQHNTLASVFFPPPGCSHLPVWH